MQPIQRQAEQFGLPAATESDMSPAADDAQEDAGISAMAMTRASLWSGPNDGSAAGYVG